MRESPQIAGLQAAILRDQVGPLDPRARVLDLGCGNGSTVRGWLDLGFDAYGCDFKFKKGDQVDALQREGRIVLIAPSPYRLPYPDASFDLVVSNQVMEHVRDYPATLAEMRRVLKPGGHALHMFPSRLMPIEPHTHVPLATVVRSPLWLAAWARMGIRTPRQAGLPWREVAAKNEKYLAESTNYLTGPALARHFAAHFADMRYAERSFLANSPHRRGRVLSRLGQAFPPLFALYRCFWARVILARA